MATDYGGTYGDQPWHGAQPPYPGQPSYPLHEPHPSQPSDAYRPGPGASRSAGGPPGWQRRSTASLIIAVLALVLGVAGLAVSLLGVATQLLPRQFTAAQRQLITSWEFGRRWRELPASDIFPASPQYVPPAVLDGSALTLGARRIGIARQATCRAATDRVAAAVLDRDGCARLLRATYTDGTDSYVVTIGVAVLPSTAQAAAAAKSLANEGNIGGIAPGVRAVPFSRTPAAAFTDQRRQLSGVLIAGTYVVLYAAGYADSRPREPIASDSYGDAEMTSAAAGVARAVLSVLARPVASPSCPGTPGC